jgi:hypothetical protein
VRKYYRNEDVDGDMSEGIAYKPPLEILAGGRRSDPWRLSLAEVNRDELLVAGFAAPEPRGLRSKRMTR